MTGESKTIFNALSAIREQLLSIASYAHLNAMLSHGDPALLLPAPAVGLMAFYTDRSLELSQGSFCRSVQPLGPFGEVLLSPITAESMIHPWTISSSTWINSREKPESGQKTLSSGDIAGIRLVFSREKNTNCAPGWMSLHFSDPEMIGAPMSQLRATSRSQSLELLPATLPLETSTLQPHSPGIVHYHIMSLTEGICLISLPVWMCRESEIEVEIWFPERILSSMVPGVPSVRSNVVPVWNSLMCQYPSFEGVEQWISESENRLLHGLVDRNLGEEWTAWSFVTSNVPRPKSGDWKPRGAVGQTEPTASRNEARLCFAPPTSLHSRPSDGKDSRENSQPILSILLSADLRERLDARGESFRIKYRSTTGSAANSIPDGSEFVLVNGNGTSLSSVVSGRLVGCTWGGSDSFALLDVQSDLRRITSYMYSSRPRTIGDVSEIVASKYGQFVEIVDQSDLLASVVDGSVSDLFVRVRFLKAEMSPSERRCILRSCEAFLSSYLSPFLGLKIIPVDIESSYAND